MENKKVILKAENLCVGYRKKQSEKSLLEKLNLNLKSGELVALLGANGAGKSSLIRTLCGMQEALEGQLFYGANALKDMTPEQKALWFSVVLTERDTFGQLSVFDLVALGRTPYTAWLGRLREEDKKMVLQALEDVGMQDFTYESIYRLSDGEYQKVMIARALAQDTSVIFLDEPTAFIDVAGKVEVMRLLHKLAREKDKAILLSTHDLDMALQSADQLCLLLGNGKVVQGIPEDLVVNGSLSEAFDSQNVHFDVQSGRFTIHNESCVSIAVNGEGIAAFWTIKALERAGFAIDSKAEISLQISAFDGVYKASFQSREYHSIADLVSAVILATAV